MDDHLRNTVEFAQQQVEFVASIQRQFAPLLAEAERYQRLVDSIRAATPQIDLDRLKQGIERTHAASVRAGDLGWTLPLFSTPREFVELVEGLSDDDIDASFVRFYEAENGENFSTLVKELLADEALERWRPLLAQCITAYGSDLHIVVIPGLLSVCEGIIIAAGGSSDATKTNPKPTIKRILDDTNAKIDGSLTQAIVASIHSFVERAFQNSNFAGPRPRIINRHWILHGRDVPAQWTKVDALRLFQAVHTLAWLLRRDGALVA